MEYETINESLTSIVNALNPNADDTILSCGGSCDASFALLEYAGNVEVVDHNPLQIKLIQDRVAMLRRRDYDAFHSMLEKPSSPMDRLGVAERKKYFTNERLDKIRKNLDKLTIRDTSDIFSEAENENRFTKVYLSNAIEHARPSSLEYDDYEEFDENVILRKVASNLPKNGLIYLTEGTGRYWKIGDDCYFFPVERYREEINLSDGFVLRLDEGLTNTANTNMGRFGKYWGALVYKKMPVANLSDGPRKSV